MTTTFPTASLIALARVDYLDSSLLCIEAASALRSLRLWSDNPQGGEPGVPEDAASVLREFRAFIPLFLGVDAIEGACPEDIQPYSLTSIAPALRSAGLIDSQARDVRDYLRALGEMDQEVGELTEDHDLLPERVERVERIERFCEDLANAMTSSAEKAFLEGQTLPL